MLHSGGVLASASGDGSAKLWRFTEGKCTATLPDHQQPGECLRGGGGDGLWRAAVRVFLACAVWDCSWHSGGDVLATCSMDHTVKVWDASR